MQPSYWPIFTHQVTPTLSFWSAGQLWLHCVKAILNHINSGPWLLWWHFNIFPWGLLIKVIWPGASVSVKKRKQLVTKHLLRVTEMKQSYLYYYICWHCLCFTPVHALKNVSDWKQLIKRVFERFLSLTLIVYSFSTSVRCCCFFFIYHLFLKTFHQSSLY